MPEERLVRLRALVRQIYGGRALKPGDEFPALVPERSARGLIALHFAELDGEVMTTENCEPLRRGPGRPPGSYSRRDMRAKH